MKPNSRPVIWHATPARSGENWIAQAIGVYANGDRFPFYEGGGVIPTYEIEADAHAASERLVKALSAPWPR